VGSGLADGGDGPGTFHVTVDNSFTAYVNGQEVRGAGRHISCPRSRPLAKPPSTALREVSSAKLPDRAGAGRSARARTGARRTASTSTRRATTAATATSTPSTVGLERFGTTLLVYLYQPQSFKTRVHPLLKTYVEAYLSGVPVSPVGIEPRKIRLDMRFQKWVE
jgi:hypothetical protein